MSSARANNTDAARQSAAKATLEASIVDKKNKTKKKRFVSKKRKIEKREKQRKNAKEENEERPTFFKDRGHSPK